MLINVSLSVDKSQDLRRLRTQRRRTLTAGDRRELEKLPDTLAVLEEEIDKGVQELGSNEFRNLPGSNCTPSTFSQDSLK